MYNGNVLVEILSTKHRALERSLDVAFYHVARRSTAVLVKCSLL